MNFLRKAWQKSRWIECPPLKAGELLRQNKRAQQGLVVGMRLAVLEEQAAVIVAEGALLAMFPPGAYQLDEDKMPRLAADKKYEWLFPAELYFLNLALSAAHQWQAENPLLSRDPEQGLIQLVLRGEYDVQVADAEAFMQQMVLEQGFYDWPSLHQHLRGRLNELAALLLARQQMPVAQLEKLKEKTAQMLARELNRELKESGLVIRDLRLPCLELHPLMQRLLSEQQDHLSFNQALLRQIVG